MSKKISFSYHHNMKKFNIKPPTEIINAGSDASYIKSDTIRFSSTYKTSVLWSSYNSPLAEMPILYGSPA